MTTPEGAEPVQPPVGPEGVLVIEGSQLQLRDIVLNLDGSPPPALRVLLSWEIWPMWLRVAIEHEAAARRFRAKLLQADGPDSDQLRADLLASETRACMVAITASAFAFEAMALSAAAKAGLASGIGSRTSAAKRVAEMLKQCFAIPPDQFKAWRAGLQQLFTARNQAVHADTGFHEPLRHPALRAGVPRPAHVYRLENAQTAVEGALACALAFSKVPRTTRGKAFRRAVAAWTGMADELRDLRDSLK
ncbi:hypothetical protein ACFT1B_33640 [Streptomyces griseoincarnatus]|uniref:hypothetical protein n=1 Tax=Promicromonospora sp. NPDC057138 TaxID=3346031 RepID=UPI003639047E